MPDRWAVAAGNWSNTATWNGGTLPGAGDDVFADNRAVTIDQDIAVLSIRTTQRSGGTAGGSFTTSGRVTVTADSYAGTTNCLILAANSGSVQNGNSYGSSTANTRIGTVVNAGCVQNGNSFGGNGNLRIGTDVLAGGIQNGNSLGGTAGTAFGTRLNGAGIHYGNATGGSGGTSHGTSILVGGIAIINTATGTTSGSFGVHSTDTNRYVALIKTEVGSFAKSLSASAETTSANVPFVSFEGSGSSSSLPLIGPGGLVY